MNTKQWKDALGQIIDGEINPEDTNIDGHAINWFCCAVGSKIAKDLGLCDSIDPDKVPKDVSDEITTYLMPHAELLGCDFFAYVRNGCYEYARNVFEEIQQMSIDKVVDPHYFERVKEIYKAATD